MAVKLAINPLLAAQVAAMAELSELLCHRMADAGAPCHHTGPLAGGQNGGRHDAGGRLCAAVPDELVEKDLAYAFTAAGRPARMPLVEQVRARFALAAEDRLCGEDLTAIVKLLRDPGAMTP